MVSEADNLPATWRETVQLFHYEELVGEAFFLELFRLEADPERRVKLAYLAQVETENKTWLRGPLLAAGLSIFEPEDAVRAGRTMARDHFGPAWRDNIALMRDRLVAVHIPRFERYLEQARRRGSAIEVAACKLMVDHDRDFLRFAERDLAGAPLDEVVAPLRARLRIPLEPDGADGSVPAAAAEHR
jgi:hypothetical protein